MIKIIFILTCSGLLYLIIFLFLQLRNISTYNRNLLLENNELKEETEKIKKKLEILLVNIPVPGLIIDRTGNIKFTNQELKNLIDNSPEGHNYIEFFNQPEFIEAVSKTPENRIYVIKELFYKGRVFITSFYSSGDNEILITLKDITDTKEIIRIKKELISNISHELKTPLTVIRGYLETIYDEVTSASIKSQVETIINHTERLTGIVNDLLKLSELEETEIEFQKVAIKDLIEKAVQMFKKKITQKNLCLNVNIDANHYVLGDPYKLEDLLINLLDNAVRYTDKGEISISTQKTDNNLTIIVKDTGIGIPEKAIPHIFERFYVVDKSRSRETGGTGLGLAIVKHIVMLHNGTIDIKSSLGEGTEVIVSLPISQT